MMVMMMMMTTMTMIARLMTMSVTTTMMIIMRHRHNGCCRMWQGMGTGVAVLKCHHMQVMSLRQTILAK